MRRVLALVAVLLAPVLLSGQQGGEPTTFAWDLDPSHEAAGITWEVQRPSGEIVPCTGVAVTATDRRCTATLPRGESYQLRGISPTSTGEWSAPVEVPAVTSPGPFTITFVAALPPTPRPPMATRFYLPSTGTADISPAFDASWDVTTNADRLAMVTTRINSAMTTKSGVGDTNINVDQLLRQYISAGLAAQTLSGTIKGNMRMVSSAIGNGVLAVRVAKCASDGSGVTEILAIQFSSDTGAAPPATAASLTNRRLEQGSNDFSLDLTSTSFSAGDRLIVELGYRDLSSNAARIVSTNFGDDAASDLPEDETTTTADNPWVEFSADITFSGSTPTVDGWGPRFPDPARRLAAMGRFESFFYAPQTFAPPVAPALAAPVYPDIVFGRRRPAQRLERTEPINQGAPPPPAPDLSWHPVHPDGPRIDLRRFMVAALRPTYTRDRFDAPAGPTVVPLAWKPAFPDRVFRRRTIGPAGWPFRSALSPTAHSEVVVVVPPSTTFAEWLAEVVTERVVLAELQPAERLEGWTALGGGTPNTYSIAWASLIDSATIPGGVYRRLDEVRVNGVSLVARASIGAVDGNLGSYYFNEATSTLYVSTPTGADPDLSAAVAAFFSLFVATRPMDFVGAHLWEPRLTGSLPAVACTVEEPFTPAKTVADGVLTLVNAPGVGATLGPFDLWARRYTWKNKKATLRLGGGLLTESQCEKVATMRVESVAVGDDVATLPVRSMASILEQTVPLHTLGSTEYPNLADGLEGTYKPILYGLGRHLPAPCVNAYIKANPDPTAWPATGFADVYLVADPAVQVLTGVLAVVAVNKTTGVTVALAATQYTVDLVNCTVTVIAPTASSHEHEIRIDATGETDGASGYLDTFGEIARDLLIVLGEPATAIETSTFTAADAAAPFTLGLWIREPESAAEVFTRLQQSVLGGLWIDRSGKWRAYVLDASTDPAAVADLEDHDFASWRPVDRIDPIYSEVRLYFAHNPAAGTWQAKTASDDATRYMSETADGLAVYTALVSASDAEVIAQRYRLISIAPDTWIDADMRGLALMTAEPYDRVRVTRSRAPSDTGSYSAKRMEILGIEKRLDPVAVHVRLGDISGIADLIGKVHAVAPNTQVPWASATALEKATYAFVSDANDEIVPGDASTRLHCLIW